METNRFPRQKHIFYMHLMWSYFASGCQSIGNADGVFEGLRQITEGKNRKVFRKMLWSMMLGEAGRRYKKKYKMSAKSTLYFKYMILLLLLGKYDKPVRTYLCGNTK